MEELAVGEAQAAEEPQESAPFDSRAPQYPNGVVIELPCGYWKDGVLHKHAEFVPMAGRVRKAISKKDVREDFIKVSEIVLRSCVKRIGPYTTESPRTLRELLMADRDFLLMEVRRESVSDELRAIVPCRACKKKIEVMFNLDEIQVVRLEEGDYEVVDDYLCFQAQAAGLSAVCRFPTGADQDAIIGLVDRNPTDAQYRLYASCLLEWNGQEGPFDPLFFDDQPVKLIDAFTQAWVDKKPGPIFEQKVSCPNAACGTDIEFTFEGSDFFFPLPTRGRT